MNFRIDPQRIQALVRRAAVGALLACAAMILIAAIAPFQIQVGTMRISLRNYQNPLFATAVASAIWMLTLPAVRMQIALAIGTGWRTTISGLVRGSELATAMLRWLAQSKWTLPAILALHFALRMVSYAATPGDARHNFERTYGHSLSLIAGRGFADVAVSDDDNALPIKEFLDGKRSSLGAGTWAAYWSNPPAAERDDQHNLYAPLATTRVLDLYVAAGLWRVFGIHWIVLYTFYALVSTATCGLVYLIARRLSGSMAAALCSAALFAISPLERFLSVWSIRDVSPMWFAAAGFAWLFCVCPSWERTLWRLAAYFGLGVVAVIGLGWRTDVLILPPFLLLSLVVLQWQEQRRWGAVLATCGSFLIGAGLTFAGIRALTPPGGIPGQMGFHMAFYADVTRSRMLHLENTFQVHGSDMQNLFVARHYDQTHDPDAGFLPYLSARYASTCRAMFQDELRYNAFRWVAGAPWLYFHTLGGYSNPDGPPWSEPRWVGGTIVLLDNAQLDLLTQHLRYLFLVGAVALVIYGPRKSGASLLLLFTVYDAAILFLVLPSQKHLGMMLIPLHVFAGAGVWGLCQFLRSGWLARLADGWRAPATRTAIKLLATTAGVWGISCGIAYFTSCREREDLIGGIQDRAKSAVDAPELVKGNKVFSVALPPDGEHDFEGYLLRIQTGAQPASLVCRHVRLPHDWCWLWWSYAFTTNHTLQPQREQYYFVSCVEGSCYGDPRPYLCSIVLDGDATITGCQRVDLRNWNRLPVSTVFCDGEKLPGSPRNDGPGSRLEYIAFNAFKMPQIDAPALLRREKEINNVRLDPLAPLSQPVQHLLARDSATGCWRVFDSDGWRFQDREMNYYAPSTLFSVAAAGDFQGTGFTGVLTSTYDTRRWYLVRNNGIHLQYLDTPDWTDGRRIEQVVVGDFNGDGLDDVAGCDSATNECRVGLSDAEEFVGASWGSFSARRRQNLVAGDFNGDGKSDLAGYDAETGCWQIAISDGKQFATHEGCAWDPNVSWMHVLCRDFNGDGRDDLAAWDSATGKWQLAYSDGFRLRSEPGPEWSPKVAWRHVQAADFGGPSRLSLVGLDPATNRLVISVPQDSGFAAPRFVDLPSAPRPLIVGDFDGDGRDDLAWRVTATSEMWVALRRESDFDFERWGKWETKGELLDAQAVQFWPRTERKRSTKPVEQLANAPLD